MSGIIESGNADEVVLDMFSTISSQDKNEVNTRSPVHEEIENVGTINSPSTPIIDYADYADCNRKSASGLTIAVKFMKKWFKSILCVCILCVLILSLSLKKLDNFRVWRIEIWKWCLLATVILHGVMVSGVFMHLLLVFTRMTY
jgi:uncharacterized integral membrane protein